MIWYIVIMKQLPVITEEDVEKLVCTKGPCKYYWEMHTYANEHMKYKNRTCVFGGFETDLTDEDVYFCNQHEERKG